MGEGSNQTRRFIEGGNLDQLLEVIDRMTNAQSSSIVASHKGDWAQTTGTIIDVSENPDNVAISILLKSRRDLFLTFAKGSIDTIFLHKDDELTVQGQIATYLGLSLIHCEIIAHATASELTLREIEARVVPMKLVTAPPAQAAQRQPSASKGGRPAKPWWDELWAEMGAQLYNGGLKPSRLADIEKAMHDWVAARGDTVGETPIRKAAKLLWDAINRED
jgi:hypothetical protein